MNLWDGRWQGGGVEVAFDDGEAGFLSLLEETSSGVTPRGRDAVYGAAYRLLARGFHEDALGVFRVLFLCAPGDERTFLGLGACYEAAGDVAAALDAYATGVIAAHPSVRCELARGRLLRAQGDEAGAEHALDAARKAADALDDEGLRELVDSEVRNGDPARSRVSDTVPSAARAGGPMGTADTARRAGHRG